MKQAQYSTTFTSRSTGEYKSYAMPRIMHLPTIVKVTLRHRKMKPIVPMPPKSPFFGNNLQGPSSKNPAIPFDAEISEVINVARNKESGVLKMVSSPQESLVDAINLGCIPQRQIMICTCGTLSNRGSKI